MMNQAVLLVLVSIFLSSTSAYSLYYVLPDDGGDDCPFDDDQTFCQPLSFYVSGNYFTSNSIFYFLNGNHTLNQGIEVHNQQGMFLIGKGKTTTLITCSESGGFFIIACDNMFFSNLSVYNCNVNNSALGILSSSNVLLSSVLIEVNKGRALQVINGIGIHIVNSSFIYKSNHLEMYSTDAAVSVFYVPPVDGCYDQLINVTFQMINCTLIGEQTNGLIFSLANGMSYHLQISLTGVIISNSYRNMYMLLTSSLYTIEIDNLSTFDGYSGFLMYFMDNYVLDQKCIIPDVTFSSEPLTITNSGFYNNNYGLAVMFSSSEFGINQTVSFKSCKIYNNSAREGFGVQISRNPSSHSVGIRFEDTMIFNNTKNSVINVNSIVFINVSISETTSTGLLLSGSLLSIVKEMIVYNNKGIYGGGIALYQGSQILLDSNSTLIIYGNKATGKGGGIFCQSFGLELIYCPMFTNSPRDDPSNVFVNISSNSAMIGDDIYGLDAKSCDNINFNSDIEQTTDPVKFSFCDGSSSFAQRIDSIDSQNVFLGQKLVFQIALFGIGYTKNLTITDGSVQLSINGRSSSEVISLGNNCSKILYEPSLDSELLTKNDIQITLQTNNILSPNSHALLVPFQILPCPLGFSLSHDAGICDCSQGIGGSNVSCDIETLQISRTGLLWIGTYNLEEFSNETESSNISSCLIKAECLLCNQSHLMFTIDDPDIQCDFNRAGTLCGACKDNFSLLLGSNQCAVCDNSNLALIIVFAMAGIILVIFLLLLNLTVSSGTINGIIYFANIVELYQPVFSHNGAYPPFKQFLSWFNLNFGIKTCFFNGMDSYSVTWLQYAFPLYIWAIIIMIIWISKKSQKIARLNPVPVLATLLLLSYNKILLAVTNALHPRYLQLYCEGNESSVVVWYSDPDLLYARGKHFFLFVFSLILLFFFCIPYTLFLLFNPVLEKHCQNFKYCHFLFKFKPIFDAYNGRVKDNYRFWTGLLLVARLPSLFAVVFTNSLQESRSILLSILLTVLALLLLLSYWLEGIYEHRFLNILESWFFCILIAMIALAISVNDAKLSKIWFTISLCIFSCSFLFILGYHCYLILAKTTCFKAISTKLMLLSKQRKEPVMLINQDKTSDDNVTYSSFKMERQDSVLALFNPVDEGDYHEIGN
jgi:hypothetical protein